MRWVLAFVLACCLPAVSLLASGEEAHKLVIGGRVFAQDEIVDARAQPRLDGKSGIIMTLEPEASKRLAGLLAVHAAIPVRITLDGKLITEPVMEPSTDGDWVELHGDYSLAEAVRLAKLISGKEPLPESEEEAP